jgi:hypothetical protein
MVRGNSGRTHIRTVTGRVPASGAVTHIRLFPVRFSGTIATLPASYAGEERLRVVIGIIRYPT